MNNLKDLDNKQIVNLIKNGEITNADLTDSGICPTCFDRKNDNILYGNNDDKMIYEDNDIECFLANNPRAIGHIIISSKKHYKDMMEIDDELCKKIFIMAKRLMNIIKITYKSESVYLCTMCDGPMNHFHIQLIPRYEYEKRGSKNFVKPRLKYIDDKDKIVKIKEEINKYGDFMEEKEYEYSFKVDDIKPYIDYCKKNNYILKDETNQIRTLYRNKNKTNARITIEEKDGKIKKLLDFKDDILSDDILIVRNESKQLEFEDYDAVESILNFLKYKKDTVLIRKRIVYEKNNVKFEIDNYTSPEKVNVIAIEGDKKEVDIVYEEVINK